MSDWMSERREKRFYQEITTDQEISARNYNLVLGGVVLYGLLLNVIICYVFQDRVLNVNPVLFLIMYAVCCIAGTMLSAKSDSPLLSFIGYNLVVVPVGLVVSFTVYAYGGIESQIVTQAFLITMVTTAFMVTFSIYKPQWFEKIGGVLMVCLLGLVVAEIILMLLGIHQVVTAWIGALIFSVYIGYDFHRSQAYPKTLDNAVDSALDIYLDIINLFLKIIRILGSRGGSSNSRSRR